MRIRDRIITKLLNSLSEIKEYVLLETTKVNDQEKQTFLFLNPLERLIYNGEEPASTFFSMMKKHLDNGYYLAGWMSYEFGYLLEKVLHRHFVPKPGTVLANFGVFPHPKYLSMTTPTFQTASPGLF